jgi:hypothetical protein
MFISMGTMAKITKEWRGRRGFMGGAVAAGAGVVSRTAEIVYHHG